MQNRFGILVADVMPIYMIMPRYSHNYLLFCQLPNSNFSTHCMIFSREKPLVKTMAPGSISYRIQTKNTLLCFSFIYFIFVLVRSIYQISYYLIYLNTEEGLTTPLSRWLRGSCLFVHVLGGLCVVSYWIDTLVLKS